jgi:dipeptidyl aminopeptidase/acylaminoacyl peptidase
MSAISTIEIWVENLKETPIWVFHGAKDEIAPITNSEALVKQLQAFGAPVKFTVLPEADHFILDTYHNPELYMWFLQHHK